MAVLEAKLVITADDRTGAAFKSIEARVERISKLSHEIGRMSSAAEGMSGSATLAVEFERAERAATKLAAEMSEASEAAARFAHQIDQVATHSRRAEENVSRLGNVFKTIKHATREVSPLIMGGAGFGLLETTKKFVQGGASIEEERARMKVAGIPAPEAAAADLQSAALAAKYTNVSRWSIMESYREARSVLLHPEETPGMMDSIIAAKSSLIAQHPKDGEGAAEGLQYAIKGAEILGIAQDPARFRRYLDSFIRAQQVMGKTITPEQQFQFAQMVRSSGITLSDRFKMTTGVSLSQELKGGQAGQAIDQFTKQIIGGFQGNNHAAAKEFVALGLADKGDFETTKTGEIKGMKHGRKVVGADLAQTDPDMWVFQHLLPALEKAGYTSTNDQVAEVRRLFTSRNAGDLVAKLITQRQSYENHAKLYGEATGLDGGADLIKHDPTAALDALGTSINNFGATLASTQMERGAAMLSNLASTFGSWTASLDKWQKANPDLARMAGGTAIAGGILGGGALGYGMFTNLASGFGLKTSAVDLSAAAGQIDRAASRLGAGGVGSAAPGDPKGPKQSPAIATPFWRGLPGLLGAALSIYSIPDPVPANKATPQQRAESKAWLQGFEKDNPALSWPDAAWGWLKTHLKPAEFGGFKLHAMEPTPGYVNGRYVGAPAGPSSEFLSPYDLAHGGAAAGGSPRLDASMFSGKIEANVRPDQVQAKIEGSADVNVRVTVTPSGTLLKAVADAKASASGNLKANVGTSLPEAGPSGANGTGRQ